MTEPTFPYWQVESLTAHKIYMRVKEHGRPGVFEAPRSAFEELADRYSDRIQRIENLRARMDDYWVGDSSDAAQSAIAPIGEVYRAVYEKLKNATKVLENQAHLFEALSNEVVRVPPQEPESGIVEEAWSWMTDTDSAIKKYHDDTNANISAYMTYSRETAETATTLPYEYPVIDATAVATVAISKTIRPGDHWWHTEAETEIPNHTPSSAGDMAQSGIQHSSAALVTPPPLAPIAAVTQGRFPTGADGGSPTITGSPGGHQSDAGNDALGTDRTAAARAGSLPAAPWARPSGGTATPYVGSDIDKFPWADKEARGQGRPAEVVGIRAWENTRFDDAPGPQRERSATGSGTAALGPAGTVSGNDEEDATHKSRYGLSPDPNLLFGFTLPSAPSVLGSGQSVPPFDIYDVDTPPNAEANGKDEPACEIRSPLPSELLELLLAGDTQNPTQR